MDLQQEEMVLRLREMCEGSVPAFDLFYETYSPFVMQVAYRLVQDRMEAEDVCHEVFLEVLRRGKDYDASRGSIKSWLAVMTRSRSLDRMRRSKKVQVGIEQEWLGSAIGSVEEKVIASFEQEAVRRAACKLPESQKKAIIGAYFGYQSQREMAENWQVPIGTVKSWVRYGLSNMRKQLERHGWLNGMDGGKKDE